MTLALPIAMGMAVKNIASLQPMTHIVPTRIRRTRLAAATRSTGNVSLWAEFFTARKMAVRRMQMDQLVTIYLNVLALKVIERTGIEDACDQLRNEKLSSDWLESHSTPKGIPEGACVALC